jgi:hypothetical protein
MADLQKAHLLGFLYVQKTALDPAGSRKCGIPIAPKKSSSTEIEKKGIPLKNDDNMIYYHLNSSKFSRHESA